MITFNRRRKKFTKTTKYLTLYFFIKINDLLFEIAPLSKTIKEKQNLTEWFGLALFLVADTEMLN